MSMNVSIGRKHNTIQAETDNIYSHKYIIIRYYIRGVSIKTIFSNTATK